jgi:hypothetical protein
MFDYENNCDIHGYPGLAGSLKQRNRLEPLIELRRLVSRYMHHLRCWVVDQSLDEKTFGKIFGRADVDIINRKHKKSYIMMEFSRVEYFLDHQMPFVYNHIRSSSLLQNMAIKIAKNDRDGEDLMFLPISDIKLIKLLKIGGKYNLITEIMYNYIPKSKITRVKFIKAYIKSGKTGNCIYISSYLSIYFNRVNMYILYAFGKTSQCYWPKSKNKYFLFHIMILHRRNRIKIHDIPNNTIVLYNIMSLFSNTFTGKNLSRLSLYYI